MIGYVGYRDNGVKGALVLTGAALVLMGVWVVFGRLLLPGIDPLRILGGVIAAGLAVASAGGAIAVTAGGELAGLVLLPIAALWAISTVLLLRRASPTLRSTGQGRA